MAVSKEKVIHVLTGPTAVGKTELALEWAAQANAEIISCDSLLFYRGMNIGTAKPTSEDLERIPHHLIDIRCVDERMDVTLYVELARKAAEDIHSRGREILVVGGSGFYLRSFFAPVADTVQVSPELRAEVQEVFESRGLTGLVEELKKVDPAAAATLDLANPRRVLRALERCRASGKTLKMLADDFAKLPSPFSDFTIRLARLDRPAEELAARARLRVEEMLRGGLVDEVRGLLRIGLKGNPSAARAIGYRETIEHLEGRLPYSDLANAIATNTRGLLKKQRTWFRTQLPPHRSIHPNEISPNQLFRSD